MSSIERLMFMTMALPILVLAMIIGPSIWKLITSSENTEYINCIVSVIVASLVAILNVFIYKLIINKIRK